MALEYPAIALSIAAIMFYLMEFGSRLNFTTSENGFITLNEWTKIFMIMASLGFGLSLLIFAYSAADNNTEMIKTTLLTLIYAWSLIILVVVCLLGAYIIYFLPKLIEDSRQKNKGI